MYLLWWCIGVLTFGAGTLTESIHAIFGWSEWNAKIWYIVGALLGGFPLAQGTVYLLMNKKFARFSSIFFVLLIVFSAIVICFSPVSLLNPDTQGLTGKVFTWKWVRYFSPLINLYSLVFLVGGAIYSAMMYRKTGEDHPRYLGNILIAIGGLLPSIGGTFTRFGHVEVLFVTELAGLALIYRAYLYMRKDRGLSIHQVQNQESAV